MDLHYWLGWLCGFSVVLFILGSAVLLMVSSKLSELHQNKETEEHEDVWIDQWFLNRLMISDFIKFWALPK